jgi:thioredoxin reductase
MTEKYEVIIVGGSYAGLSAALALGRARRKVLIIDAGEPCNRQTPHSHNFLTQDGKTPGEISGVARDQVRHYPSIAFLNDRVTNGGKLQGEFSIETAGGKTFQSPRLLLATGVKDIFPPIPGLQACWGISVLHCPYCHGYEVADAELGILANGDSALDFVKLLLQWSKQLVVLTNGPATFSPEGIQYLQSKRVPVLEGKITELIHHNGELNRVRLGDGETISLRSIFTRLPFEQHTPIARDLGCLFTDTNHILVDELGKTNVDGLYAAGDCTTPMRSVSIAVASGTKAAMAINRELLV